MIPLNRIGSEQNVLFKNFITQNILKNNGSRPVIQSTIWTNIEILIYPNGIFMIVTKISKSDILDPNPTSNRVHPYVQINREWYKTDLKRFVAKQIINHSKAFLVLLPLTSKRR